MLYLVLAIIIVISRLSRAKRPVTGRKVRVYTLYALFGNRRFHVLFILAVMCLAAWLFVRVLRLEWVGILAMTAFSLWCFRSVDRYNILIVGGINVVMFPVGMLVSKYERALSAFVRKLTAVHIVVWISLFTASVYVLVNKTEILTKLGYLKQRQFCLTDSNIRPFVGTHWEAFSIAWILMSLSLSLIFFVLLQKIELGNPVSRLISDSWPELLVVCTVLQNLRKAKLIESIGEYNAFFMIAVCLVLSCALRLLRKPVGKLLVRWWKSGENAT